MFMSSNYTEEIIGLPKKGTDRAMRRVDSTRADLSMIMFEYFC
jgi:hypothetical protein